ncbi:hypothetical protein PANT111_140120 [Pantoea brenneri]|uniref:Uncharacterized protein n=1 Tax=Pantoea brenneri TaxID=472694 RepID=A0AAX3J339_9GAMM|nr:hypothetical protein PANT111_140120 [Pantoea brenneri]
MKVAKRNTDAGWSSLVARRAHNPKVVGSNPAPATNTSVAVYRSRNVKDAKRKNKCKE